MSQKAQSLLRDAVIAEKPFFLTIAPIAPHGNIYMNGSALDDNSVFEHTAPVSAKRHEHLFEDVKVPRTQNFNPDAVCLLALQNKLHPISTSFYNILRELITLNSLLEPIGF